jgi:hypothetical protein
LLLLSKWLSQSPRHVTLRSFALPHLGGVVATEGPRNGGDASAIILSEANSQHDIVWGFDEKELTL